MGSETRQRTHTVLVRMTADERQLVDELAEAADCSRAEIVRAILFDRTPQPRIAGCSSRHPDCTRHHRELVDGYDEMHAREKLEVEDITGMYAGDLARWRENGGTWTTFRDYLKQRAS